MTLSATKASVSPGQVYDVTNHYITRTDHPCFGTNRRTVVKTTGSSVYMTIEPGGRAPKWPTFQWPKAAQVQMDDDGTIRLYGGGIGQAADELFLTLKPAAN